jgi:hypothetical protein
MWNLTVLRLMCGSAAISALALPCATVTATLSSRSVRGTIGCLGGGRRAYCCFKASLALTPSPSDVGCRLLSVGLATFLATSTAVQSSHVTS